MFLTNSIMLKRIGGMVPLEFSISTRKYNQLFNNMGTVYFYNSIIYINIDKEFLPGIISLNTIVYRLEIIAYRHLIGHLIQWLVWALEERV